MQFGLVGANANVGARASEDETDGQENGLDVEGAVVET